MIKILQISTLNKTWSVLLHLLEVLSNDARWQYVQFYTLCYNYAACTSPTSNMNGRIKVVIET
jgi:hypothetical protein